MGKTNEQVANEARINEMLAEMTRLKAENERLAAEAVKAHKSAQAAMSIAVSSKGGVSVYGLGRFPVTLYGEGWERLASKLPEILAFVREAKTLGALSTGKGTTFVQPNGLPLKFVAKVAQEPKAAPTVRTTSAL